MGYLRELSLTEPVKLGLITSKKTGHAVERNQIRRRLRAIFQRIGQRIEPGHWIVLIARASANSASSAQLEKEWIWMLRKSGLLASQESGVRGQESGAGES